MNRCPLSYTHNATTSEPLRDIDYLNTITNIDISFIAEHVYTTKFMTLAGHTTHEIQ